MTKVFNNTKLIKDKNKEDNSIELNESSTSKSTDKLDWDFILDREWLKTKK